MFQSRPGTVVLRTTVPLKIEESGVAATFTLDKGESVDIQLEWRGEVRPLGVGGDRRVWEIRGPRQRFTYSALMTWVAFDLAARLARDRGLPAPVERWRKLAASAHRFVQDSCWDRDLQAYVMHPGSWLPDASVLVMPLVKFAGPTDPRFLSTLDRIGAGLTSDSLVCRYAITGHDGPDGGGGTLNLCSFWYVEALTRAGRVKEARTIFEKMLTHSNHLGLYGGQIGGSGEALGNFPQARTHLALISVAVNLDRALDRR